MQAGFLLWLVGAVFIGYNVWKAYKQGKKKEAMYFLIAIAALIAVAAILGIWSRANS